MWNSSISGRNSNTTSSSDFWDKNAQIGEADVRVYVQYVQTVVGVVGNIIALCVLHRKAFIGSSSAVYIQSLAVVDSLLLILLTFPDMFPKMARTACANAFFCYTSFFTLVMCRGTSVWSLLLFTGERLLAVLLPYKAKTLLTVRRSKMALGTAFLLYAVLTTSVFWFEGRSQCKNCLVTPRAASSIPRQVHVYIDTASYVVIPIPLLTVSTVIIVIQVYRMKKKRKQLLNGNNSPREGRREITQEADGNQAPFSMTQSTAKGRAPRPNEAVGNRRAPDALPVQSPSTSRVVPRPGPGGENRRNGNREKGMVIILVSLNVLFIVTRLPIQTYRIIKAYDPSAYNFQIEKSLLTFVLLNQSLNIFLYAFSGSRFRTELVAMFKGAWRGRTGQ